jgi:HNH endonuclease
MNTIPLCLCGCGQPTKRGRGGEPNRYVQGHNPSPRRPSPGSVNQGHHYIYVNRKRKAYHRLVMENHLCRPLEPWEVVHHIDGNPLNNNIENLQVMSRSEHLVLHLREMPIEPWTDEEVELAVALHNAGMTIERVAAEIDKSYFPTRRRLARARRQTARESAR